MDQRILALGVDQCLLADGAHANNIETFLRESEVVLCVVDEQAGYLRFPKLKALKLLQDCARVGFYREILHKDIICVDIDSFVAYHQLFKLSVTITTSVDRYRGITNLEETFPHGDRLGHSWVFSIILDQEETYVSIFFIRAKVKTLILVVIDNALNG